LIFEFRFKHFFYTYPGVFKKFQFSIFHKLLILFKEQSKNFITKENLDEKVREALENPINLDYAIDLNGAKIENVQPQKCFEGIKATQRGRAFDHQPGYTLRKLDTIVRLVFLNKFMFAI